MDYALVPEGPQSTPADSVLLLGPYRLPQGAVVSWTGEDIPGSSRRPLRDAVPTLRADARG
jgi:hypothetical protein